MTTKLQIDTALNEFERKMIKKIEDSYDQFIIRTHEILSNVIQSSVDHSKDITNALKKEITEIKNHVDIISDAEIRAAKINLTNKYLKLRPISELKEQEHQFEENYSDIDQIYRVGKKRKINEEILDTRYPENERLESPDAVENTKHNEKIVKSASTSYFRTSECTLHPESPSIAANKTAQIFTCRMCNYNFTEISLLNGHQCIANVESESDTNNLASSIETTEIANENSEVPRIMENISVLHGHRILPSKTSTDQGIGSNTPRLAEKKSYACSSCDLIFKKIRAFQDHLLQHQLRKFQCDRCCFESPREKSLSDHLKSKAHEKLKFQCQMCSKQFRSVAAVGKHTERVHEMKNIKCLLCQQAFDDPQILRKHYCPPICN